MKKTQVSAFQSPSVRWRYNLPARPSKMFGFASDAAAASPFDENETGAALSANAAAYTSGSTAARKRCVLAVRNRRGIAYGRFSAGSAKRAAASPAYPIRPSQERRATGLSRGQETRAAACASKKSARAANCAPAAGACLAPACRCKAAETGHPSVRSGSHSAITDRHEIRLARCDGEIPFQETTRSAAPAGAATSRAARATAAPDPQFHRGHTGWHYPIGLGCRCKFREPMRSGAQTG